VGQVVVPVVCSAGGGGLGASRLGSDGGDLVGIRCLGCGGVRRSCRIGVVLRDVAGVGIPHGAVVGAVEDARVLALGRLESGEVGVDGIRITGLARHVGAGRGGGVESLVGAADDVVDVLRPVVLGNLGVAHGFASRG